MELLITTNTCELNRSKNFSSPTGLGTTMSFATSCKQSLKQARLLSNNQDHFQEIFDSIKAHLQYLVAQPSWCLLHTKEAKKSIQFRYQWKVVHNKEHSNHVVKHSSEVASMMSAGGGPSCTQKKYQRALKFTEQNTISCSCEVHIVTSPGTSQGLPAMINQSLFTQVKPSQNIWAFSSAAAPSRSTPTTSTPWQSKLELLQAA